MWAQLKLTAPESESKGERKPLDLVLTIDRSGSMSGHPLESAKSAARTLIERLGPNDRVGLVSFGSNVTVHCELTSDRAMALRAVDDVYISGSTNLSGGLYAAQDLLKTQKDRIPYVILLSDGVANIGDCTAESITPKLKSHVRFTSMGLGEHYDEVLLEAIAESSGGNYYYVQGSDRLQAAFTEELGELQGITLIGAQVEWSVPDGVEVIRVLGPSQSIAPQAKKFVFGDMSAKSQRDLVLELKFTTGAVDTNKTILQVAFTAQDEKDQTVTVQTDAHIQVTDSEDACSASVNADVIERLAQLESAWAKNQAADMAQRGDYDGAKLFVDRVVANMNIYMRLAPGVSHNLGQTREELERTTRAATTGFGFNGVTSKMMRTSSYDTRNYKSR